MNCKAYFDGSCFLNYCAIGYVIRDPDGSPVIQASEFAGRGDALKAEYLALWALVERLTFLSIGEAVIHGDSRTVVYQVNGRMNTRNSNRFRDLIIRLRCFFHANPGWTLKWIPRQENGMADALATEGLDEVRRGKQRHHVYAGTRILDARQRPNAVDS
jgi:ribonuclease HI